MRDGAVWLVSSPWRVQMDTLPDPCDSQQPGEWPACSGPRVSKGGGLQRCSAAPRAWQSCPLPRADEHGALQCDGSATGERQAVCCEQLNQVLPGLFIASGQAAAQWAQLAACGVTHVVNAAPSVELCWHKPQLVRGCWGACVG